MKAAEIRELSTEELVKKEAELREDSFRLRFKVKKEAELREDSFRLRFKLSTGELEDTSKIKQTRKDIARIKTILAERRKQEVANGK